MMFLSNLARRDLLPEMMDQPGLATAQHVSALRVLARINWLSGSAGILWRSLRRLAEERPGQPLRVLDIATGGGDVPIRLQRRARRAGLPMAFAGADVSDTGIAFARDNAERAKENVDFFRLDVLNGPLPEDYDVLMCSLFLHHLETEQAVDLLRRMSRASRGAVLVNDLIRSKLGYVLALAATRLLTTSPVVHYDGPQSVRAAFTIAEARQLAAEAGLQQATVSWRWPFRFLLEWRRQP